jgi:adenosylhomocysteine nucleosidase
MQPGATSPIAIQSAMREELHALLACLDGAHAVTMAGRRFHTGRLAGRPVVLVLSGIGKVAAAITTTLLVRVFEPAALVFTGAAGGLAAGVEVGDVVVADALLQHDMDASPLFPRFEVPLTGIARFACDPALTRQLAAAATDCLAHAEGLVDIGWPFRVVPRPPRVHAGLVVSGDRFVSTAAESAALRELLPDALAVEMEGAAFAQACTEFGRPFALLRSVSDRADDAAHVDFPRFMAGVASVYTQKIVMRWLERMAA